MKINRTCCNALIGTEQEQINQLYEFVKALAGNYFEGFEIMGTYSPTVNYNKKYMLVFFEGSTYVKTVDGDSVNFSPALNPDKWALFSSGTPADVSDLEKVIEGSDTVVVDVNEAGTALEIHADYENIVRPLERALKKPVSNPTETVLAGVDAQGEQVLLPVSSVGGGVKWYKHTATLTEDNGETIIYNEINVLSTKAAISTTGKINFGGFFKSLFTLSDNSILLQSDLNYFAGETKNKGTLFLGVYLASNQSDLFQQLFFVLSSTDGVSAGNTQYKSIYEAELRYEQSVEWNYTCTEVE